MISFLARRFGAALAALSLLLPSVAQAQAAAALPAAPSAPPRGWLYENSDVPMDPAWRFGELDNGLRYAVRANRVPPGQVSIRVRVDVGSLMEKPQEGGFAHFIEHLTFRGSKFVPDGEAKRVWQRLGATFGSDSNAQTTTVGTTYALDLPQAGSAGIQESLKILAGMMESPNIVPEAVEAERAVVMAERRESLGPGTRIGDATRAFYFAGQPLGSHSPIGTEETLKGATADTLKAFHDRWYRPDRAVVIVSGDVDPVVMEAYIKASFSSWKARGPATPIPDFGKPDPKAPRVKVIVEPSAPYSVSLAYLRSWKLKADTIAYNQAKLTDALALQLINRRLEAAASAGASFLQAAVLQDNSARSTDATYVSITPISADWEKALKDVRAIIQDARVTPPTKADVDREFAAMEASFAQLAENATTEASASQAQDMVGAVDIRETVVSPQAALDIFRSSRQFMTPEQLRDSTRRLFTGEAERALLTLRAPQPNAQARLAAALAAPVQPAKDVRLAAGSVTMDQLPKFPPAGKVASRTPLGILGIEDLAYENGVRLLVATTDNEADKVRVAVRFGNGQLAFAPGTDNAIWAAPYALMASGIGNLGQRELDELTNGRRLSLSLGIDEDAFSMEAISNPRDYADQLRLFAAKLAFPRWDAAPLNRIKAALTASYDPVPSSADEAINRDLLWLLRDKDQRFAAATPASVAALTPERFKDIWAPILASGPIEIIVFGSVKSDDVIAAVGETFGALPPRPAVQPPAENAILRFPAHPAAPVVLRHNGLAEQAAAAIAWPTSGGVEKVRESRQLDMLARIINDRLFERLRSMDGAAYTPSAASSWPFASQSGGYVLINSQLRPERIPYFFALVDEIANDLRANPISADELARQVEPIRQLLGRASTGNAFWMSQLEGYTRDPRRLAMMRSLGSDLLNVTPAELQALAQRYLIADKSWSAIALSKDVPMPEIAPPALAPQPSSAPATAAPTATP